jgi:hypothetical protein
LGQVADCQPKQNRQSARRTQCSEGLCPFNMHARKPAGTLNRNMPPRLLPAGGCTLHKRESCCQKGYPTPAQHSAAQHSLTRALPACAPDQQFGQIDQSTSMHPHPAASRVLCMSPSHIRRHHNPDCQPDCHTAVAALTSSPARPSSSNHLNRKRVLPSDTPVARVCSLSFGDTLWHVTNRQALLPIAVCWESTPRQGKVWAATRNGHATAADTPVGMSSNPYTHACNLRRSVPLLGRHGQSSCGADMGSHTNPWRLRHQHNTTAHTHTGRRAFQYKLCMRTPALCHTQLRPAQQPQQMSWQAPAAKLVS